MAIVTVGIDLAKNVSAAHGIDGASRVVLQRSSVARGKLLELVASLPPCLIGSSPISRWIVQLQARVGWQKTLLAVANENARILWAVLVRAARSMRTTSAARPVRLPEQQSD